MGLRGASRGDKKVKKASLTIEDYVQHGAHTTFGLTPYTASLRDILPRSKREAFHEP